MQMFDNCKVGDAVTLHDQNTNIVATGRIIARLKTKFKVKVDPYQPSKYGGDYNLSGRQIGAASAIYARPGKPEEIAEFNKRLADEAFKRQEETDAKTKAAYDALPEGVKLVRKLKWLFDVTGEVVLAEAPIEHLRGLVQWAETSGLETD